MKTSVNLITAALVGALETFTLPAFGVIVVPEEDGTFEPEHSTEKLTRFTLPFDENNTPDLPSPNPHPQVALCEAGVAIIILGVAGVLVYGIWKMCDKIPPPPTNDPPPMPPIPPPNGTNSNTNTNQLPPTRRSAMLQMPVMHFWDCPDPIWAQGYGFTVQWSSNLVNWQDELRCEGWVNFDWSSNLLVLRHPKSGIALATNLTVYQNGSLSFYSLGEIKSPGERGFWRLLQNK